MASQNEQLDVVNRLLDCKQIDVNVQNEVSGVLIASHPYLQILFPNFFLDVFFN